MEDSLDKNNETPAPADATDVAMSILFDGIGDDPQFNLHANELEQMFKSRVWEVIRRQIEVQIASNMAKSLAGNLTDEDQKAIRYRLQTLLWFKNIENNLYAAHHRAQNTHHQENII